MDEDERKCWAKESDGEIGKVILLIRNRRENKNIAPYLQNCVYPNSWMDAIDAIRIYNMLHVPNGFVKGLMQVITPTTFFVAAIEENRNRKKKEKIK